ncbi:MAG TPA: hypothetical protein VGD98_16490 [Ktedonobacteraceae bacterium]
MRRQFRLLHTVRYDECTCDSLLAPRAFFQYMQDIAARDVADVRLEVSGLWVARRTIITFAVPVAVHTRLELKTFGLGFTRITAQRGYEARYADEPDSEPIIAARTLWVYIDQRGRPARLPEGTAEIWLSGEALVPQVEAALASSPASEPELASARVRFSNVDLAYHLNNAAAVEMLDDAAWEAHARAGLTPDTASFIARDYDIEYVNSPRFGEELVLHTWFDPLPRVGQEFRRIQQITRDGKVMVRACSRWSWPS